MILVTGGTGFLGNHLLNKLSTQQKKVRAIYRASSIHKINPNLKNIEWVEGDVLDINSLNEAMKGITEVYHAAAMVSFNKTEHELMMKINVDGTENMVNCALENKIEKFGYISSVAVLGRSGTSNFINEQTEWEKSKFNSKYAVSKMLAEREVFRGAAEGLNVAIVNPSVIIGSGDWKSSSTVLFNTVNKGMPFYTTGINGFVAAEDVAEIIVQLMDKNIFGERYILNENNYTYQQIFTWIAESLQVKPPSIKVSKWMSELSWRLFFIRNLITGKSGIITKETATTALLHNYYSNEKISTKLNFNFTSIHQSINHTGAKFLAENKKTD
jgi:nucleoside-diphosphate-sugar epimerase